MKKTVPAGCAGGRGKANISLLYQIKRSQSPNQNEHTYGVFVRPSSQLGPTTGNLQSLKIPGKRFPHLPLPVIFLIICKMKKIIGVIAIMLSVVLLLLYRQLTNGHGAVRTSQQKVSIPAIMQENLILGNMLFQ
jgi:hypothetical protein